MISFLLNASIRDSELADLLLFPNDSFEISSFTLTGLNAQATTESIDVLEKHVTLIAGKLNREISTRICCYFCTQTSLSGRGTTVI